MSGGAMLSLLLLGAAPGAPGDHVTSAAEIQSKVVDRSAARAASLKVVKGALKGRDTAHALAILGATRSDLERGLSQMTDVELRDLAERVVALRTDPRAGLSRGENNFLIVFLVVATVLLVLAAVD
jgi:hypothetical protein